MKRYNDMGTKMQNFDKGSPVWLHNPHRIKGLCPKLQSNWEDPYVLIHKLDSFNQFLANW
jgi:hypothetical protein